jgi:hypothetical protein
MKKKKQIEKRLPNATEKELQTLAMAVEEGPMDAIVQHFEGWNEILSNADGISARDKVRARRLLTWTVCTPAERALLAAHRKKFGTQ